MRETIVLVTLLSITAGANVFGWKIDDIGPHFGTSIKYDGLRATFGWSDALADIKYFYNIPRTIHEVEGAEWRRTERPNGPMKDLRMYCPPGRTVCPLYDTSGFVAGVQIAIPLEVLDPELKPEKYFTKWSAPAVEGEPAAEYWTATQYYVTEDALKAGAGPIVENGATLQDGGVWVKGLDGKMLKIPATEAELKTTLFKKQNCVPNMGTHYYYNMTKDLDCNKVIPWFALVTKGDLLGVGFQTIGKRPGISQKEREWFEDIPNGKTAAVITVPNVPQCYLDKIENYGILSIHIYFIDKPWTIKCSDGDSIEPAPVIERLLLNGYRYATQIGDSFKKIING